MLLVMVQDRYAYSTRPSGPETRKSS